jgi:hypothetical protein
LWRVNSTVLTYDRAENRCSSASSIPAFSWFDRSQPDLSKNENLLFIKHVIFLALFEVATAMVAISRYLKTFFMWAAEKEPRFSPGDSSMSALILSDPGIPPPSMFLRSRHIGALHSHASDFSERAHVLGWEWHRKFPRVHLQPRAMHRNMVLKVGFSELLIQPNLNGGDRATGFQFGDAKNRSTG